MGRRKQPRGRMKPIIRGKTSNLFPIDGGKRYRNKNTGKKVTKRDYQKLSLYERTGLKLSVMGSMHRRSLILGTMQQLPRAHEGEGRGGQVPGTRAERTYA